MNNHTMNYLDDYCERAGEAGVWAEPINAITNAAFIIAAVLAFVAWNGSAKATLRNSIDIVLLMLLLVAIGLGSGAWHLFATRETLLMDVIPIVVFMNVFLLAASVRLLKLKWWGALLLLGVFQGLNVLAGKLLPPDFLNGTIMYLPAYAVLAGMVLWLRIKKQTSRHLLFSALLWWTASLAFRTIDMQVCTTLPIGTHFLWHTLNAVVLYKLLSALILEQAKRLESR